MRHPARVGFHTHDRPSNIATANILTLGTPRASAVADYVSGLLVRDDGIIFQELLRPDPVLAARTGFTVSTVRMMMLQVEDGFQLLHAIWRIPVSSNWIDNFHGGKTGNMLGLVDPETGRVLRVVSGVGFEQREIERHPDTGETLLGCQLPDWADARAIALAGAAEFPRSASIIGTWP